MPLITVKNHGVGQELASVHVCARGGLSSAKPDHLSAPDLSTINAYAALYLSLILEMFPVFTDLNRYIHRI